MNSVVGFFPGCICPNEECRPSIIENKQPDHWIWDDNAKSPHVVLSKDKCSAYFYIDPVEGSTGTSAVRGNKAFVDGIHYWEIIFQEVPRGTSVMVGVGMNNSLLQTKDFKFVDLVGIDHQSWGLSYKGQIWHRSLRTEYCEPFYDLYTTIGCLLNMYNGDLTFFCNGKSQGVAFTDLNKSGEALYPMISSTAAEMELEVGLQTCQYCTLQEKCCLRVLREVKYNTESIDNLPLPKAIINHLKKL